MARNDIEYSVPTGTQQSVSTANSNLDGSGTLSTIVTASSDMIIQKVFIKATGTTTEGMVRLFVYDGSSATKLLEEIKVNANTPSGTVPAFGRMIDFGAMGFILKSGYSLKASTENAENFEIFASCREWSFPVSETTINNVAYIRVNQLSTANSNLNGSGTVVTIANGGSNEGIKINSITIKATDTGSISQGMIRLFIKRGGVYKLIKEIEVPEVTQSSTQGTFERVLTFPNGLYIASWANSLVASTENADTFEVTVEGTTWSYS